MHDLLSDRSVSAPELVEALRTSAPMSFGDPTVVALVGEFATRLLRPAITRLHPELASLGFFLRRSEISRVLESFATSDDLVRTPRGLVVHVPPANVDTIFVYSWALSVLCGNANVVRVSDRSRGAATVVLDVLRGVLTESALAETQRFVSFSHEDPAMAELSAACDLRVIWGGDAAVRAVRRHPLSPRAIEMTFPDRSSLAAIDATAVIAATDDEMTELAAAFTNDVWWFDQAACSSPRALVWIGDPATVSQARATLFAHVQAHLDAMQLGTDPSMAVQRRVALYGAAADLPASTLDVSRPAIATLTAPEGLVRGWFGAGGFFETTVAKLIDIAPSLTAKDQTLGHFGIARSDLLALVNELGGRALDRIVPIGQALQFQRHWDGHDLMGMMSKVLTVSGGRAG